MTPTGEELVAFSEKNLVYLPFKKLQDAIFFCGFRESHVGGEGFRFHHKPNYQPEPVALSYLGKPVPPWAGQTPLTGRASGRAHAAAGAVGRGGGWAVSMCRSGERVGCEGRADPHMSLPGTLEP